MSIPDYTNYSLHELYEALDYLDEDKYSERAKIIREQIEKRNQSEESFDKIKIEPNHNLKRAFDFKIFLLYFEKGSFFLSIISFIAGTSIILLLFGVNFSPDFGYSLSIDFPGYSQSSENFNNLLKIIIATIITLPLLIGSIGSFFNKKFIELLALPWGIMSIGIHIWFIKWWPQFYFDISFSFGFTVFVPFYFKINLIATFIFMWSIVANPKLRREFFKN